VQTLLQTVVHLLLGVALANMLDVKRTFTKARYTKDKAEQLLDLNTLDVLIEQAAWCVQGTDEPLGPTLHCNAVLAIIPNYVEVEACRGVITKYAIPMQRARRAEDTLSIAYIGAVQNKYNQERGLKRLQRDYLKA
jgi:hypothetical protein